MGNIKDLLRSKKFKVLLFTIAGLVCAVLSEQTTSALAIDMGWKAILVYIGSQGIADFGKYTGLLGVGDKIVPDAKKAE